MSEYDDALTSKIYKLEDRYQVPDAFAGFLFGRGYDIVFDRDPRNFEKGLNWFQVLTRMNDCNYFVPILTDEYIERVTSKRATGPASAEWNHAMRFFPARLTFIGIWRSGVLPKPFDAHNTVDVRDDAAPWADPIQEMFSEATQGQRGIPKLAAPAPAQWPKFIPY